MLADETNRCLLVRPDGYVGWEGLDTTRANDMLRLNVLRILSVI